MLDGFHHRFFTPVNVCQHNRTFTRIRKTHALRTLTRPAQIFGPEGPKISKPVQARVSHTGRS